MSHTNAHHKDAVCVGFGPAGIALACAVADAREAGAPLGRMALQYLEQAKEVAWQPELLLAGTDINHHILRDLVTPRNPRSRYSFAMYLKAKERMFEFGLLGRPASRHEWSDYIAWVAAQVDEEVAFGTPATEILPVMRDGRLDSLRVATFDAAYLTRQLVLSCGSTPRVPEELRALLGSHVFHTSQFLTRLKAFGSNLPRRWIVIGSGQSASESVLELLTRREDIRIHSVHRSAGFRLTQLGQFPNQVFSPAHVDYFHSLDHEARGRFFDWSRATNYAGIDPDESQKLYSLVYEDRLAGRERLLMHPYSLVRRIEPTPNGYEATLADTFCGREERIEVDAIALATGYEQPLIPPLLTNLQPWLAQDLDGGLKVDRDYAVALTEDSPVKVFVNGLSERTHGVSDSQSFSLMALRAERITRRLSSTTAAYQTAQVA